MPTATRAHDCLINVHFGDDDQPDWMFRVKDEDAPVLSITRTVSEAVRLDLPPEVMDNYLHGNAQRFFFDRLEAPAGVTA